ncbi:CHRD domain-containing protein [Nonomuraea zeae]|uniref:CHRD domain-containing protein n=2 Tax=Nonomuraea zeae TaxID=1642303 RepID=A0A5S4FZS3_9ACTN|nr:CHRD domain-containing protein [Nonomuraea zeae]
MSIRKIIIPAALIAGALLVPSMPANAAASGDDVYLAAGLRGANEVGAKGDADGRSTVVLRISGNDITFAARWNKIGAPTAGHVHLGAKDANGEVKLEFFTKPLPASVLGVTGTVKATPELVKSLLDGPGGFYANLHDAAHPKGAVRGQFHRLSKPIDLNGVLHGSNRAGLSSRADGAQEVAENDGKKRGDQDGQATWWLRANGSAIAYTASWSGLGQVTNGHLHKGVAGKNGPVVADLFAGTLPENVTGVAGETPVTAKVVKRIAASPGRYYTNLHTLDFNGGAVRGQLSGDPFTHPRALTADVLRGAQIYACTQQPSGGYAFTQFGVTAKLRRSIDHSFVTPASGPPQWIAPDGSAVRGAVVTRTPNGTGNIPELVLDATQSGAAAGLLAHATQILRLNTTGGVAPAGACEPGSQVQVAYGADYLFLG